MVTTKNCGTGWLYMMPNRQCEIEPVVGEEKQNEHK